MGINLERGGRLDGQNKQRLEISCAFSISLVRSFFGGSRLGWVETRSRSRFAFVCLCSSSVLPFSLACLLTTHDPLLPSLCFLAFYDSSSTDLKYLSFSFTISSFAHLFFFFSGWGCSQLYLVLYMYLFSTDSGCFSLALRVRVGKGEERKEGRVDDMFTNLTRSFPPTYV